MRHNTTECFKNNVKNKQITPKYSIDVLALNDEEGVRFNKGFLSSKAITELLDEKNIYDNVTS